MFDRKALIVCCSALLACSAIARAADPPKKAARPAREFFVEVVESTEADSPQFFLGHPPAEGEVWTLDSHDPGVADKPCEDCDAPHDGGPFHFDGERVRWPDESWSSRPFGFSLFGGGVALDDPRPGEVEGDTGYIFGFRGSWDYCAKGGFETRFALSKIGLDYPNDPLRVGDADLFLWDVNWLYYPWDLGRVRPFVSVGMGISDIKFPDELNRSAHETVFGVPIGIGVKVRCTTRLAFRADLQDNIAFEAGQIDTMHNLSFTAGLEWRFGGTNKKTYYPWQPGRSWW